MSIANSLYLLCIYTRLLTSSSGDFSEERSRAHLDPAPTFQVLRSAVLRTGALQGTWLHWPGRRPALRGQCEDASRDHWYKLHHFCTVPAPLIDFRWCSSLTQLRPETRLPKQPTGSHGRRSFLCGNLSAKSWHAWHVVIAQPSKTAALRHRDHEQIYAPTRKWTSLSRNIRIDTRSNLGWTGFGARNIPVGKPSFSRYQTPDTRAPDTNRRNQKMRLVFKPCSRQADGLEAALSMTARRSK